jgi:DNA-binding winged helix-turn-helix (wHTH) protein
MGSDVFSFGRFRLVARERVLTKDSAPVSLGSRAFDLLLALVERAGETVNREQLFRIVWPDVVVSKVNLRVNVAALRKVLEDGCDGNRFIINVSGRGYRFVAPVSRFQPTEPECMFAREAPVTTLTSHLSPKRLPTLRRRGWGRAGVGLAIASDLAADSDGAVCMVDCVRVEDSSQVAMAVASAIGCEVKPQQSLASVLAFLQDKEMLLVFENCQHVFAGVSQLTQRLLTEAPLVQVLVASQGATCLPSPARSEPLE